jgi:hypothetical protein
MHDRGSPRVHGDCRLKAEGNQRCQPFTWIKDADQILAKVNGGNTTATSDHYDSGRGATCWPWPTW